jgi:transposase
MRFVGLDLHKRTVEACVLDEKGRVLGRHSVACDRAALTAFAADHLTPADRLAVEATTNTGAVADILRPFVAAIAVGNPCRSGPSPRPR